MQDYASCTEACMGPPHHYVSLIKTAIVWYFILGNILTATHLSDTLSKKVFLKPTSIGSREEKLGFLGIFLFRISIWHYIFGGILFIVLHIAIVSSYEPQPHNVAFIHASFALPSVLININILCSSCQIVTHFVPELNYSPCPNS